MLSEFFGRCVLNHCGILRRFIYQLVKKYHGEVSNNIPKGWFLNFCWNALDWSNDGLDGD